MPHAQAALSHRRFTHRAADVVGNRIIDYQPDAPQGIPLAYGNHFDFAGRGGLVIPAPRQAEERVTLANDLTYCSVPNIPCHGDCRTFTDAARVTHRSSLTMKRKSLYNPLDAARSAGAAQRGKRESARDAQPATKDARSKALRKLQSLPPLRDEWPRP